MLQRKQQRRAQQMMERKMCARHMRRVKSFKGSSHNNCFLTLFIAIGLLAYASMHYIPHVSAVTAQHQFKWHHEYKAEVAATTTTTTTTPTATTQRARWSKKKLSTFWFEGHEFFHLCWAYEMLALIVSLLCLNTVWY